MDYKEKVIALLNSQELSKEQKEKLEGIFPELKENEDEKVRKEIINYFKCQSEEEPTRKDIHNKWIAWLEKQGSVGEIVSRCKTSWYNEGKIQGQIEGLSDEEKYQQGWHDALEKQGEQKPWSKEDEENMGKILDAIGSYYYLTTDDDVLCNWLKSIKQRIGG